MMSMQLVQIISFTNHSLCYLSNSFFKDFILFHFIFREGEGEKERNINVWLPLMHPLLGTWPATQACALEWESN